jgi:hypothetical protein
MNRSCLLISRVMSPRGTKQSIATHRVDNRPRNVSPDDVRMRLIEAAARERADTRTEAQRWLGDLPPGRSALAQRVRGAVS